MEKNTLENMCVYYKDAEGLRFEKQEHIIPAFFGRQENVRSRSCIRSGKRVIFRN